MNAKTNGKCSQEGRTCRGYLLPSIPHFPSSRLSGPFRFRVHPPFPLSPRDLKERMYGETGSINNAKAKGIALYYTVQSNCEFSRCCSIASEAEIELFSPAGDAPQPQPIRERDEGAVPGPFSAPGGGGSDHQLDLLLRLQNQGELQLGWGEDGGGGQGRAQYFPNRKILNSFVQFLPRT